MWFSIDLLAKKINYYEDIEDLLLQLSHDSQKTTISNFLL